MAGLVWLAGISAIVAIVGIFVFITKEGVGFFGPNFDIVEFLTSPLWRPTSEENPTYGTMALIVGTASVTGFAVLTAVPFPWVLPSTSRNLHRHAPKRPSRFWSNCWPPSQRGLGFHRPQHHEPAHHRVLQCSDRTQHFECWRHSGIDECAHHVHHCGRCTQGRSRQVPGGSRSTWAPPNGRSSARWSCPLAKTA